MYDIQIIDFKMTKTQLNAKAVFLAAQKLFIAQIDEEKLMEKVERMFISYNKLLYLVIKSKQCLLENFR